MAKLKENVCTQCFIRLRDAYGGRVVYIPRGRGAVIREAVIMLRKKFTAGEIAGQLKVTERRILQILAAARREKK